MHNTSPSDTLTQPTFRKAMRATLAGLLVLFACASATAQERTDNRRLFWTGSNGSVWDNSTASWMTTGSYLTYADRAAGSDTWVPTEALPETTFITGDVVTFDSWSDQGWTWTGSSWAPPPKADPGDPNPDVSAPRVIEIASDGVIASDVVFSGFGSFTLTGGGITATASSIADGSIQLSGTGIAATHGFVTPGGRLIKYNVGTLTLSNTTAHHFEGGIHHLSGILSIADNRALGDNDIITQYLLDPGTVISDNYGHIYGEKLAAQIMQPDTEPEGARYRLPATVLDAAGHFYGYTSYQGQAAPSLHIAPTASGIDITGDIYIGSRIFTLNIEGTENEATISGRILGMIGAYGASRGAIVKTGDGTLILTGSQNWFYANGGTTSKVLEGRLVATHHNSLGTGPFSIDPGAVIEFRGVNGTLRQAFVGNGDIEITQGSNVTFNWRDGVLYNYESLPGVAPANNDLGNVTVTGTSRFTAMASGTYASVLGGNTVTVDVMDRSTLAVGREGISSWGSGGTDTPIKYPIYAGIVTFDEGSTLLFKPNAFLNTGAIYFFNDSVISFGAAGVSQLKYKSSNIMTEEQINALCAVPAGMSLVAVNRIYEDPSSYWYEFIVVNQGANPLNDIALTINTIDAVHDTISSRIADDFVDPVATLAPSRGRKWVNNIWMRYMHSEVEYDAAGAGTPGVDGHIGGAVMGFNGMIPGRVFLGAHVGFADNTLDTTNDTTLKSKQKFLGVHAAQIIGKTYISLDVTTGKVDADSIRNEPDSLVRARWKNSYYSGAIQFGVLLSPWKQTKLKPYAGMRYSRIKVTDYYEAKAESPLLIENFNDTCAQALYGLAASQKLVVFKRDLSVDASIGRKHIVSSPRSTLNAYYDNSYYQTRVPLARGDFYSDFTTFSLSARMFVSAHTQVGISCDYETSSASNRTTFSGLVGYSW